MKLIIAGGRDYLFSPEDYLRLNMLSKRIKITEIVSGKARGADTCGESWATSLHIPIKEFKADWDRWDKRAGSIRNTDMAKYADAVVLFPGGTGTENMHEAAKEYKLKIYDWRPTLLVKF